MGYTPAQKASIEHVNGPLLISAGAGSGKTFTLTRRIAWALTPGSAGEGRAFVDDIDQVLAHDGERRVHPQAQRMLLQDARAHAVDGRNPRVVDLERLCRHALRGERRLHA